MIRSDEADTLDRLQRKAEREAIKLARLERYYEGEQVLSQLGLAVPPELQKFLVIVNWPGLVVDALDERLDVEGFRYPDADEADDELWRVWQANDLDEESQLAHLDALIYGRSFVTVGTNPDDPQTPLCSIESAQEMTVERDPATRQIRSALKLYDYGHIGDGGVKGVPRKATLYLPDVTLWLERQGEGFVAVDADDHELGRPPVVGLVNRGRVRRRRGRSEMDDAIDLTDAAARSLTNLQVAQETHAVPQRGVLGATKGDFVGSDGKPLTAWEAYFGAVWALGNEQAKTFQFSASDLRNFETTLSLYAKLLAGVYGLPLSAFGFSTDNPVSADAIRAAEARLVKRAERRQRAFGGSWEDWGRLVRRFQTGRDDDSAKGLETLWRDAATPTKAQAADAVVKLFQAGILPVEAAWEELGYSAARRKRLREMRDAEATDPTTDQLLRALTPPADAVPPAPGAQPEPVPPAA